ncbi:MAG: hypothetical protein MUC92_11620 [Fimbriimonadaceae bacterium]|jgi:hypothetical protein|nr:hypothetical protein [Fimbriimonadaceae bacterium]
MKKPMVFPFLALVSLSQPQSPAFARELVPETSLSLLKPKGATFKKEESRQTLEWTQSGVRFTLAAIKGGSQEENLSTKYSEAFARERSRFNNRFRSVENLAPVSAGFVFGVTDSIGFIIETGARGGPDFVAWQFFRDQGWEYEIKMEWPGNQTTLGYRVFSSVQFHSPGTLNWPSGAIGSTGIQSVLGSGFVQEKGQGSVEAFRLASPGLNGSAVAIRFTFKDLGATTPDQATAAMKVAWVRLMSQSLSELTNNTIRPSGVSFQTEDVTREGVPMVRTIGEAREKDTVILKLDGYFVVEEPHVLYYVVLSFPQDPESVDFASRLLSGLKLKR